MKSTPDALDRQPLSASLPEIAAIVGDATRILAISHISPDGDAIGSLLGLGWILRALDHPTMAEKPQSSDRQTRRSITLACADSVPAQFAFLPGASEITSEPSTNSWDVVIALDASDALRLGSVFCPDEYADTPIINLDHHITNLYYGSLNYVDPTAASTAQVVLALADALGAPLSQEAATCLLTGLVTDTLCFRTSNVAQRELLAAIRLMEAGGDLVQITQQALNYRPVNLMRLSGIAMSALRVDQHVIWTHITQDMRALADVPPSGDVGLASQLIDAPEACVSAVFSEKPNGLVEISFRSRPGYNVANVALSFGGGGHPQASGCTVPGPLADAEARVLPLLTAIRKADPRTT